MRRVTWSVLTGIGAFFVVVAVLSRFLLPGQVIKFPLNEYTKGTLVGTGISYFSAADVKVLTGVKMVATNTIEGNVAAADAAGSSRIAVWRNFLSVRDVTNKQPFEYSYQSLAFDRRTGELVNCCGNVIGPHRNPHVSGQGYVFPVGTQPRNYQVYDTTLLKPVTFRYAGMSSAAGVKTYKFVEHVNNQQVGTQTLPGSLVGISAPSVTLPEFYTITKTEWVDPVTGVPLAVNENTTVTLQDTAGAVRLLVFSGDLSSPPQAVRSSVAANNPKVSEIRLLEVIVPIVALVLGIILLAAGLLLGWRRPRAAGAHEENLEPVGSSS